eukprot:gnl/Hemi2/10824_TR3710_c0_g1_i1.p1 gnl/Hemi2/10824_TR3710_c0_g1~~gnl/Hemi2/10824_TR3710_c0_g1_i1.p1  ORF type:complete len:118 (-),score=23.54 gnl/Hemi2/10824_TR3710_c0_g1_i1:133-486(-)
MRYLRIPVDDTAHQALHRHFAAACDFIEDARSRGDSVLVHCVAGISRSASVVLAYLVKCTERSLLDSFRLVRACRPLIEPNLGFWRQLVDWEKSVCGTASVELAASPFGWAPVLPAS